MSQWDRALMIGLSIWVVVMVFSFIVSRPARCVWCYADACYRTEDCGGGCVCVTQGTDPLGVCIGVDAGDEDDEEEWPWSIDVREVSHGG